MRHGEAARIADVRRAQHDGRCAVPPLRRFFIAELRGGQHSRRREFIARCERYRDLGVAGRAAIGKLHEHGGLNVVACKVMPIRARSCCERRRRRIKRSTLKERMRLQHAFAERSVEIPRAHLKWLKKRKERKGTRERSACVCVCVWSV